LCILRSAWSYGRDAPSCVDTSFAEAPYRFLGGEVTLKSGRIASVDKGEWDCSMGL
jgi:hypothetical protein